MPSTKGNQKNVLGRGLKALLQDSNTTDNAYSQTLLFKILPIGSIAVNPFQPRQDFSLEALQELSLSIKTHGIIQPLTVRQLENGSYQLIAGERRLRAAIAADLKEVPAYIRTTDDQHMLELALIENIQREALNAIEVALSYQRLLGECNLTQEALAERVGKDRTTVTNYLRLLKLPPDVQIALRDQKISMGHARALINLDTAEKQLMLLKRIVEKGLSVREVEQLVQELSLTTPKKKKLPEQLADPFKAIVRKTTEQLAHQFGTNVSIKADAQKKGEIKIAFDSEATLQKIVAIILQTNAS
ncbi:MAG TPA: ParB/RepB/Spo0J family partition protein [Amoebophilaceae bacterium]|jgi:ParB family chromosome partitioning protein|nr:ParB/RepB/Spo0J family partition protein [Amoebophilaceae bacterium]